MSRWIAFRKELYELQWQRADNVKNQVGFGVVLGDFFGCQDDHPVILVGVTGDEVY